jgi:hypothetical protein
LIHYSAVPRPIALLMAFKSGAVEANGATEPHTATHLAAQALNHDLRSSTRFHRSYGLARGLAQGAGDYRRIAINLSRLELDLGVLLPLSVAPRIVALNFLLASHRLKESLQIASYFGYECLQLGLIR